MGHSFLSTMTFQNFWPSPTAFQTGLEPSKCPHSKPAKHWDSSDFQSVLVVPHDHHKFLQVFSSQVKTESQPTPRIQQTFPEKKTSDYQVTLEWLSPLWNFSLPKIRYHVLVTSQFSNIFQNMVFLTYSVLSKAVIAGTLSCNLLHPTWKQKSLVKLSYIMSTMPKGINDTLFITIIITFPQTQTFIQPIQKFTQVYCSQKTFFPIFLAIICLP